jgi:hypothetical protein
MNSTSNPSTWQVCTYVTRDQRRRLNAYAIRNKTTVAELLRSGVKSTLDQITNDPAYDLPSVLGNS